MNWKLVGVALVASTALSGCAAVKTLVYAAEIGNIEHDFGNTAATATLPQDKEVVYNGATVLGFKETGNTGKALAGDARIEATFGATGAGSITGKLSDFVGAPVDDVDGLEDASEQELAALLLSARSVEGDLDIGGAFSAANFDAVISGGPLEWDDQNIAVGGTVGMEFRGDEAGALFGDEDTDGTLTIAVDGAPREGAIIIRTAE